MRSPLFIAVAAFLVVLFAASLGVVLYDDARANRIAEGVRVAGIDLGGLERGAARERLRAELLDPLNRPVVVRHDARRFTLSPEKARIAANLGAMVEEALRRSREGGVLARTWRGITGEPVRADLEPRVSFSRKAVRALVRRVERKVERPAKDASVTFSASGPSKVDGRDGFRLRTEALRRRVESAILDPAERTVKAKVVRFEPKVTSDELERRYATVVIVNRSSYSLRLFKNLELVRSYPIAVGKAGLETPAGLYNIQNKAVNPSWHVPNSDWAGELAGRVIPPGPENPIKARWMGIYAGAGIHGTADRGSIGTNASHGCIRMLIEDVVELYDRVPVGAAVYIA